MAHPFPQQIVPIIFSFLGPEDVVNAALTCSSFHELAANRLQEHRDLMARYHSLSVDDVIQFDFLWRAFKDPWLWFYVRQLKYQPEYPLGKNMGENYLLLIELLSHMSPYSGYDDNVFPGCWERAFNSRGDEYVEGSQWQGFLLGLLMSYLPNLSQLHIRVDNNNTEVYRDVVETIIEANKSDPHLRGLRKLSCVTLIPWMEGFSADLDWVIALLPLPSLRKFNGSAITCYKCFEMLSGKPKYSLKEVNVTFSDIHHFGLLSTLRNLRRFSYHHHIKNMAVGTREFDLYEMLHRLERYCSKTLEILEFRNGLSIERMGSSLDDLLAFKKLKKLMIPAAMIMGPIPADDECDGDDISGEDEEMDQDGSSVDDDEMDQDGNDQDDGPDGNDEMDQDEDADRDYESGDKQMAEAVPRLVDILPASIEVVDISVVGRPKAASYLIEGLVELKQERLPNLKAIIFRGQQADRKALKPVSKWKELGASVAVEIEIGEVLPVKTFADDPEEVDDVHHRKILRSFPFPYDPEDD